MPQKMPPPLIFSKIPSYSPLFVRAGIPPRDFVPTPLAKLLRMGAGRYYNISSYQFSLGVANSGTAWHYHTDAASVLLHGKKRWFFREPAKSVLSNKPPGAWKMSADDKDTPGHYDGTGSDVLECIQEAGDVVIVPNRVGHATLNIGKDEKKRVSVGLTFELAGRRIMEPFHVDL